MKPDAQLSCRNAYRTFLFGIPNVPKYLRYYYTVTARADQQMGKVLDALKASRFYEDTIVIFTSDHGDLLSAHANMHQKWYAAYDEMTHVPMIISNPKMFPRPKKVESFTNHIDVIPTMLGLAGINPEPIRQQLAKRFTDAQKFVGRNLAPLVTGKISSLPGPVYFMTDDDISRGFNQVNWLGWPFDSVVQPNHIETVITTLNGDQWKLTRYFDNPQFWTTPGYPPECGKDNVISELGAHRPAGEYRRLVTQTIKTRPEPDQFEMYNVTADPLELKNLANNPLYRRQLATLKALLEAESCAKRQQPNFGVVPGAPVCT